MRKDAYSVLCSAESGGDSNLLKQWLARFFVEIVQDGLAGVDG